MMIPAIDVPTEFGGCRPASENFNRLEEQEDMLAFSKLKYGQDLTKLTSGHITSIGGAENELNWLKLIEKSVIIHRDENGFGIRIKGQSPVFVEHVHENGAAWRAGVRRLDRLSKVNGIPVANMDHKEVVLIFKSCSRFVGLTLLTSLESYADSRLQSARHSRQPSSCGQSSLAGSIRFVLENSTNYELDDGRSPSQLSYNDQYRYQSPYDLQAGSYYEDTIRAAHQKLSVGKVAAQRCESSQSFNLTQMRQQRQLSTTPINGNTNYNSQPPTKSPTSLSARVQPVSTRQATESFSSIARRSESVSFRSSQPNERHQQQTSQSITSERRTSISETNCQIKAACINCRRPIVTVSQRENNPLANNTCCDCQSKFESLTQRTKAGYQDEEALTNREGKLDMGTIKRFICANNRRDDQSKYKLTPSASAGSLHEDSAANEGAVVLSLAAPAQVTQPPPPPQPPVVNKRLEIIREFIDTEKTHTDRLRCLDELFYRPLKVGSYMTGEHLRMVFSCHRTLYKIHRQIYRILRSANYNLFSEPMIGSALREIFEGDLRRRLEKAACSFCAAQSTNAELLNKLTRRDTKVGEFLAQVTSQQMVGRLGIKDLLASCFQRLTKYPLLLENLLKATPIPPEISSRKRASRNRSAAGSGSSPPGRIRRNTGDGNLAQHDELVEEDDYEDDDNDVEDKEEEETRNAQRMLAISLAEEREFIERALSQSRQILVKVNESVKVAMSHNKLKEIWKRTDKYPGVPLIDITKQQMVHEGLLTLRLSKRSFDVYVLLLNDYIIILTREGQDKYRLKFFTPEGKSSSLTSSSASTQTVYSPVFKIDEHLATRDAATDENGFYLLCKRKDDSRIYEFASRSPADRLKWRDRIQWTIDRQIVKANRRPSCESTLTKSSSEISAKQETDDISIGLPADSNQLTVPLETKPDISKPRADSRDAASELSPGGSEVKEPTKIAGTISYVEDDGIVMPSKMGSSRALVEQAIQVNIVNSS